MTVLAHRYELIEELGRGGHGSVWRAIDQLTRREVAVKRLRSEYSLDARLRRRLRREARAVARLEHPNIVRLYDMGEEDDGSPFIAMELVRGHSLRDAAVSPEAHLDRLVDFIDQMLGALAFAHARGVVHRDLKPENVLIATVEGREVLKLLDFGFARVEDDTDDQLTATGRDVFGSPTYMAPEQASGEFDTVGPATDLYALAIIIWELMCGRPPFTGNTGTEVVVQHITAPLPAFEPRPDLGVPRALEAVLAQALEKEPARRFDSAGEMRRALNAVFATVDDSLTLSAFGEQTLAETRPRIEPVLPSVPEPAAEPAEPAPAPVTAAAATPVGREALQRWLWEAVVQVGEAGEGRAIRLDGRAGDGRSHLGAWLYRALVEGGWMTPMPVRFRIGPAFRGLADGVREALGLGRARPDAPGRAVRHATDELVGPIEGFNPDMLARWLWRGDRVPAPEVVTPTLERLLRGLAQRRPMLLWLDDLHRAASADLAVVEMLLVALRRRPAPLLIVLSRRTDLPERMQLDRVDRVHLEEVLERTERYVDVRRVEPLPDAALREVLLQAQPLAESALDRLVTHAGGSPQHALESLQLALDSGALERRDGVWHAARLDRLPDSLRDILRARVEAALGDEPGGRDLITLARRLAGSGDAFYFGQAEIVARGLGMDAVRVETAIDALVRQGLLEDTERDAFAFRQELMREALLPPVSEMQGTPVAAHLAGERHLAAGDVDAAARALDEAAAGYGALEDAFGIASVALARGRIALQHNDPARARAEFESAVDWYTRSGALRGRGAALRAMGELAYRQGDRPRATELLDEAADLAERVGDDHLLGPAAWRHAELLRQDGQPSRAAERYELAVRANEKTRHWPGLGRSLRGLADAHRVLGRHGAARSAYVRAARVFDRLGDGFQLGVCFTQLGRLAEEADDLGEAEQWYRRALGQLERFEDPMRRGVLHAFLARLALRRGDAATRDAELAAARALDAQRPLRVREWPRVLEALGRALLDEGQRERARALFERAGELWSELNEPEEAERLRALLGPSQPA